eukprot:9466132-Pyramimonas_sp.AAC.1
MQARPRHFFDGLVGDFRVPRNRVLRLPDRMWSSRPPDGRTVWRSEGPGTPSRHLKTIRQHL